MAFSTAQLSPSILHSLVDNFFEGKKAMVKERLRMSMDNIVNNLFDEMVEQVKEMLLPSKDPPQVPKPSHVIAKPPAASKTPLKLKPTLTKVRKVLPSYRGPKQANQPSTINKPTPNAPVASVSQQQFGQKRTADSDAPINDTTYDVNSNNHSEPIEVKKIKLNDQLEEPAPFAYDDLDNFDVGDIYEDTSEPQYHTLQPAAVDYPSNSNNGDEDVQAKEKTIEVHIQYQTGMEPTVEENENVGNSVDVSSQFVCQEPGCGKVFASNQNLKRHSRLHTGAKPYACSFPKCSFESADQSNVIRHIRTVHLKNLQLDEGEQPPEPTVYLNVKQELLG